MPEPILVNPPAPLIAPGSVALLPLVSIVPPPALRVTARLVVRPARNCSAPPLKVSAPEGAPRLASLDTDSVPALRVHGVAAFVVPVNVQGLARVFSKFWKPRYCALPPICDTSKLPLVVPPRASVLLTPAVALT